MRFYYVLLGTVSASTSDGQPAELKGVPINHFPEASAVSYSKFSETEIPYQGELTEAHLFVSSDDPRGVLVLDDTRLKLKCIDEFVGFSSLNKAKIESAIKNANYNFCESTGMRVSTPNIKIEHKLTCDPSGWTRLDCKFIPKGNPEGAFFASRMGEQPGMTRKSMRAVYTPVKSLFVDHDPGFTDRISCDKPLQKPQIDECNSLLSAWSVLNNVMGAPVKATSPKRSSNKEDASAEATEEVQEVQDADQGGAKLSNPKEDQSTINIDMYSGLYALGGILAVIILLVVATQCMGNKKKEREDAEDMRRQKRRERKEVAVDSAPDSPEEGKRIHHRKGR